jgi:hypothetical protein
VKRRRIEVGIVRPNQSAHFRVKPDSVEGGQVVERPKQGAVQDRLEVNALLRAVRERDRQRIRPDDAEMGHPMNGMGHGLLPEWIDLDGWLARLQERLVVLQLRSVDLRPCLDQTQLRLWQTAAQAFDGVDAEHCCMFLVERMNVRTVVLYASFHEHADDDSEKPRELRH